MGLKQCLLACAVLVACKKPKPPPPPPPPAQVEKPAEKPAPAPAPAPAPEAEDPSPFAWTIHSGDGAATLKQKPTTPGKCYLECTLGDGTSAWNANTECFGEKADRKFLAMDCVRTVVMMPAPPRDKSWRAVQVMRVYKKDKLDYPVPGIAVMKNEKLMKASTSWLKGCYGAPGEPPHYSADNLAVEYESIDGKAQKVPLVK